MTEQTIPYKDRLHQGYILGSTELRPHYYWFFFRDIDLIQLYGDSIAFREDDNGRLVPARTYCAEDAFIEAVRQVIERFRESSRPGINANNEKNEPGKKKELSLC